MKTIKSIVVFLIVELFFVLASPDGAVITCYHFGQNSWEKTQTIKNASTHQIKEICPGNGDQNQRIEVKGSVKILYEDSFKGLPNLREIKVSETNLEEIQPGTFKDLPELDNVDLSKNNLQEIKSETFVNLKVGNLSLHKNSISLLQEGAFVNLSDVEGFILRGNNLQELKRGVFQNLYVTQIDLRSNKISKIEVGTFAAVFPRDEDGIYVDLYNNRIEEIDSSVFDNKHIVSLRLEHNSISALREGDLRNLPKLKKILLSENKISVIASKAFEGLNDLDFVGIDDNKLKEWDSNWFSGERAMGISLSHNSLETIPAEAFTNIPEGSKLYLDHNRIKSISDSAFNGVTRLECIDLSYNKIKEWNLDLLKNVEIEDFVDFTGNKFECPEDGGTALAPKALSVVHSCRVM